MGSPELEISKVNLLFQTSDGGSGDTPGKIQPKPPLTSPQPDPRVTEQNSREGDLARRLGQGLKKVLPRTPRSTEKFPVK